jgi:predicted nucleic acid-binding protein
MAQLKKVQGGSKKEELKKALSEEQQKELAEKTAKLQKFLQEEKISLIVSGEFVNNQIVTRIGVQLQD